MPHYDLPEWTIYLCWLDPRNRLGEKDLILYEYGHYRYEEQAMKAAKELSKKTRYIIVQRAVTVDRSEKE